MSLFVKKPLNELLAQAADSEKGLKRTLGAGNLIALGIGAIIGLKLAGQKLLPPREARKWVAVLAAGIIIGFPIFSTLAMQTIPAGDAGLIVAVGPVLTAVTALFYGHGRPRNAFWIAASIGTLGAMAFAITRSSDGVFSSGGSIWGYASMALAMFLSSNANIAGATLVKRGYNAFYVIMWAIVMSIPVLLPITVFDLVAHPIIAMPSLSANGWMPLCTHSITQSATAGAIRKPWRYKPLIWSRRGWGQVTAGRLFARVGRAWVAISRMRASANPE